MNDTGLDANVESRSIRVPIQVYKGTSSAHDDFVTVEEPLEIRLSYDEQTQREPLSLSITMRTPGQDVELVKGFLYAEGIIRSEADLQSVNWIDEPSIDKGLQNTIHVVLKPKHTFDPNKLIRNLVTSSSCGVCSKSSLEALDTILPPMLASTFHIAAKRLGNLPDLMRSVQREFSKTGGLHACATFSADGKIDYVAEDVGRHNAMDKLIGHYVGAGLTTLETSGVLFSGRASFELIHKAAMGRVPLVASIGPPSSLALELATARNMTLIGFLRKRSFNVYHGAARVSD